MFQLLPWLGLGALLVSSLLSGVAAAQSTAPVQSVQDELSKFGSLDEPVEEASPSTVGDPIDLAPDLTILVAQAGGPESDWVVDTRRRLLDDPVVAAVAVDSPADDRTAFHVRLDEWAMGSRSLVDTVARLKATVGETVSDSVLVPAIDVGGRAVSDEAIQRRFGASVIGLALLAVVLGALIGRSLGWRRAAVLAVALAGSVWFSGRVAARVVGPFDGTVAAGPVVGAVAGLVFALIVALRILKWYESPVDGDGATLIRFSLAEVASDVILVLGSVVAVIGMLWIVGALTAPLVATVIGALVGSAFTAAVVAPILAALHRPSSQETGSAAAPVRIPLPVVDHLKTLPVVGLIGLLVVFAAFAFRAPGRDLIDYRALPGDAPERTVGDLLGAGPGDPTEAVVTLVEGDSVEATTGWAQAVVGMPEVAWVDTAFGRFSGVGSTEVDPSVSLASEEQVGTRSEALAIIVPAVPMRSAEGGELSVRLEALADDRVEIVDTTNAHQRGSLSLIIAAVVLLAAAGAAAVMVETENTGYALTAFALGVVEGAAIVGLYRMVASDATASEVISALTVIRMLGTLFELEFLHDRFRQGLDELDRLHVAPRAAGHDGPGDTADGDDGPVIHFTTGPLPGRAVLLASPGAVVAMLWLALGRFLGGGPTVGRFGLALTVGLLIEAAIGLLVLRPMLFGERAVYHTVARPLRSALHSGSRPRRSRPISVDDPTWRRLVTDLLVAEFGFQTDPDAGGLNEVFLDGTPLFRKAGEQHRNLNQSGLRVTGRAPQVKKVEAFRQGPSSMVSVTVDHPERHLIDHHGTVYGVRRPQRRSTMLWLVASDDGRLRIAESIDLGFVPLDVDQEPATTTFPEVASMTR